MSKLCYFDVSGWQEDGSPLPAENRQEVIDILEELIADDFKQNLSEDSAQFMRFSTEYEYAPEEVQSACSNPESSWRLNTRTMTRRFSSGSASRGSCASTMTRPVTSCRLRASPSQRRSRRCR